MSKLSELCRSVKVYNDYEFFGDQPYITWAQNGGRSIFPPWYAVTKRGVDFGDGWYANGSKLFSYGGSVEDKHKAFNTAVEFLESEFGIKRVARSPFGDWGDAEFVKRRIAEIKEMARKQETRE